MVAPLGGVEGEHVGAGRPAGDGLADRAGVLEEGHLAPWGAGGLPEVKPLPLAERPAPPVKVQGEPVGPVPELARAHRHLLEARIADVGDRRLVDRRDGVDEGGVVAAGGVQPLEGDRVRPGR